MNVRLEPPPADAPKPSAVLMCDGGLDHVVGFVRSTAVFEKLLEGGTVDLAALAEKPLFVPETMSLMTLLEQFKRAHLPVALVVDEFGGVEGLVSLTDAIGSIVGELPTAPAKSHPSFGARMAAGFSMVRSISTLFCARSARSLCSATTIGSTITRSVV